MTDHDAFDIARARNWKLVSDSGAVLVVAPDGLPLGGGDTAAQAVEFVVSRLKD